MSFIFDNLAPSLNMRFKIYFKSFFESIPVQKTVSEVLKMWYFLYSAFWSAGQWGGGGGRLLAEVATGPDRTRILLFFLGSGFDFAHYFQIYC